MHKSLLETGITQAVQCVRACVRVCVCPPSLFGCPVPVTCCYLTNTMILHQFSAATGTCCALGQVVHGVDVGDAGMTVTYCMQPLELHCDWLCFAAPRCATLCHAVQRCATLCNAASCCAVLCHAVPS